MKTAVSPYHVREGELIQRVFTAAEALASRISPLLSKLLLRL